MAVNDLMMRIQLLADTGKSTAELKRLQTQLQALTNQLKSLEQTSLSPLANDLKMIKAAQSELKATNLQTFAKTLDDVKKSFSALSLPTTGVDALKKGYSDLEKQIRRTSIVADQHKKETTALNARLVETKKNQLTSDLQSVNQDWIDANDSLKRYSNGIKLANEYIREERQWLAGLKNDLRNVNSLYAQQRASLGQDSLPTLTRKTEFDTANLKLWKDTLNSAKSDVVKFKDELKQAQIASKSITLKQGIADALADSNSQLAKLAEQQKVYNKNLLDSKKNLTGFKNTLSEIRDSNKISVINGNDIRSIATIKSGLRDLKAQQKDALKLQFDPTPIQLFDKLVTRANATSRKIVPKFDATSITSLEDYNKQLSKQQQNVLRTQGVVKDYQSTLRALRLELQTVGTPNFDRRNGNLLNDVLRIKKEIQSINSSKGIRIEVDDQGIQRFVGGSLTSLQNKFREIKNTANISEAFKIAPVNAQVKTYNAELDVLKQINNAYKENNKAKEIAGVNSDAYKNSLKDIQKLEQALVKLNPNASAYTGDQTLIQRRMTQLEQESALGKLKSSLIQQDNVKYQQQGAELSKLIDQQKNQIALKNDEKKSIENLIASERTRARLAANDVKTRSGGLFDTVSSKNTAQNEVDLYRGNVAALKQYLSTLKQVAQARGETFSSKISSLSNELLSALGLESAQKRLIAGEQRLAETAKSNLRANKASRDAEIQSIQSVIDANKRDNLLVQEGIKSRITTRQQDITNIQGTIASVKQRIEVDKQALTSYKEGLNAYRDGVQQSIVEAQQRIASGQLTKQQYAEERTAIRASISEQKELSKAYQQQLRDRQEALNLALKAEKASATALKNQVKDLMQLRTEEARTKAVDLTRQYNQSQTSQGSLQQQIKETEASAKAEILRANALAQSAKQTKENAGSVLGMRSALQGSLRPVREFTNALSFMFGPQMAGFAAAGTIIGLTDSFINANKQVEQLVRGLNAISGGQGRAEFQYLVDVSNKLGVSIQESAHSFLQLEATTAGTAIEGAKTKQIFESFARALNVTGADAVTFNRAFRSISQSLSKGQLYAEELKGQLAEALPGAIQVFAKAIDVTPKKFLAMVKAGQFAGQSLYDLFGLVAKQLDKTYKVGGEQDFTFIQKANLAKNAFVELSVAIGNTGVWQTFSNLMLDLRDTLKGLESDLPSIVGNLQFLAQTIKELPSPSIDWSAVGAGGSASVSFIPQSLIDLPVNIKAIVQIAVNELALLGNELFKLSNDIGLPVRESFDTIGVYIKTFFQNASNNVMQVVQGMALGFREVFYVPVLGIIADLQNRLADVNDALASGFDAAGFTDTAKSFSDMANGLRSNSSLMDDVNKKTESLRQEFIRLQTVNQGGYSALLAENLKDLAKEHKAVRDEVQREYEANRAAAQQGIDDSLAENEARKKLRDTQIQITQELREQDKLSKRDRGTRNDIIDTREIQQEELEISKRQITAEKKKLDIINAQRDAQVGFAKSQYQQWVESGSISKESADFLSRIAEQGAALKTIKEAQDAIDKYNEKSKSDNSTVTDLYREAALEQIKLAKEEAKKTGNQYKYNQLVEAELKLREEGTKSANEAADLIKQAQLKAKVGDVDKQNVIDVHDAAQKVMDSLKPIPLKTEIAPPTAPALQGDNQAQVYSNDGFILASYSKIQDAYQQTKQVTSQPLRFVVDDAQVNLALQGLNVYQSKIQDIQTRLLPNGQTEIIVTPKINESALQQGFQFIKTAAVQASPTVTVKPVVDATDVAAVKKTSEEVKKDILSILDKDGKKVNFIVVANGVKKTDEEMKRLSAQKEIPVTAFADQSSLDETKKKLDDLGQQIQKGLIGETTISPQGIQQTLDTAFGKDKYKLEIVPTLTGGVTEDGWIKNNEIKRNLIITPVAGATAEADAMIQSQIQGVKSGYEGAWQKLRELDSANQKALEETPLKKLAEIDPTKALEQDAALVSQLSQTVTKYVDVFYRTAGSGEAIAPVTAATGGYLSGYGGGDRIHALLEAGEFILRKEAVRKLGLSNVFALNNLNIPKPSRSVDNMSIPSFSGGGYVGGSNIININVPGSKSIQVSGSRESAMALANLLTRVGRAV